MNSFEPEQLGDQIYDLATAMIKHCRGISAYHKERGNRRDYKDYKECKLVRISGPRNCGHSHALAKLSTSHSVTVAWKMSSFETGSLLAVNGIKTTPQGLREAIQGVRPDLILVDCANFMGSDMSKILDMAEVYFDDPNFVLVTLG